MHAAAMADLEATDPDVGWDEIRPPCSDDRRYYS